MGNQISIFSWNSFLTWQQIASMVVLLIGRWWGKIDQVMEECDILAFDPQQNEALLGICKWTNKPQNPNALMKQAIRYEDHILYNRKARDMNYKYIIFSKNFEFEIDHFDGREVECYNAERLDALVKTLI
ncbi:MAG: hypothetical protein JW776_14710 [Candidatus Lokiarchaeota archaeon]|nr:hypothetical protein [Candidatus Lokiarchaeota archaeon]